VPSSRFGHSACLDMDRLIFFGGRDLETSFNDVAVFSPQSATWIRMTSSPQPAPRHGHTACIFNREMYVFGGADFRTQTVYRDLWCLDLVTGKWKEIHIDMNPPEARFGHSMNVISGGLFIFGGQNFDQIFQDCFVFDLSVTPVRRDIVHLPASQVQSSMHSSCSAIIKDQQVVCITGGLRNFTSFRLPSIGFVHSNPAESSSE